MKASTSDCLSMKGIPKAAINLMVDWLCPYCYVAPVATNRRSSDDFCYHCRNTMTLQQSNSDFEASAAAENLCSLQTLAKSLASINIDKLTSSIQLVQNMDLHLQHLLVKDQGLEKFQTLPDQIASAIETKLNDKPSVSSSSDPALTEQIIKLNTHIQNLTTSPKPDCPSFLATNDLLKNISGQLETLCNNESTIATSINDLKQSIHLSAASPINPPRAAATHPTGQCEPIQPEPVQHGQKAVSGNIPEFIDESTGTALLEFLGSCSFKEENGHSVASFGVPYSYTGAKSCSTVPAMPEQLQPLLDKVNQLQEELFYKQYPNMKKIKHSAPPINSCLINKYEGPDSHLPQHADNEITIHPESSIFTLSLGHQGSIKFVDRLTKDESVHDCPSHSLYHMTRKSQDFFEHRLDKGSIPIGGTRFSLTFRSINWRNKNSSCTHNDSNGGYLQFGSSKRGTFGELMPGQKFWSPKIQDIDPELSCSYNNVIILCGINDVRNASVNCPQDVHKLYYQLKSKVGQIKSLNPTCNIYVCPLLPTKDMELNKKVNLHLC